MYKIMIIEDDEVIAGTISRHIETWGCAAHTATDFRDILPEFLSYEPHLVLLDICLPFFDGYYWCAEIRKVSKVPIIFISSVSDNMNIVMAVGMGGDDFIAKPFDLSVLTAKVQALLRRTYDFGGSPGLIGHKGAVLNVNEAVLTYNGERIELSKNEYRILHTLLENKSRIVSREQIMTRLWETDSYIDDNTLTVNIARLRKKLDDAGLYHFIATKKGIGYVIE
ncbi:MAG: response regulator transcription factor [Clostridiales bacterium]|jgi:DNA-binding response OmpR family regulator|nr:response regulator transcription factor [Clostridiales bacterium]